MGDFFRDSDTKTSRFETAMWAAKLVFLSAGIISTFMFFKVAIVPYMFNMIFSVISSIPSVWISLRSWLSPPYIYIILNFIIITIAASSTLHRQSDESENQRISTVVVKIEPKSSNTQKKKRNVNDKNSQTQDSGIDTVENDERKRENETIPSEETSLKESSMENSGEKPEKKEEEEEEENALQGSLEETWKLITEGQAKARKPQLKKSDTWDTSTRTATEMATASAGDDGDGDNEPVAWARRELRKSDTFNDRISSRKEKSMSQDELNQRVEAFIKKFKRLQRLESDQRYMEMINGGF